MLVENLRAGQLERLKIGPDVLHAVNPRLVIARISGYGQDGPYRDKPAFGAIGEAIGGLRHLTAHPGGTTDLPPPRCGISISDDLAGLYAAIGLLSAVWQRDAMGTGKGRMVDVNLVDSVFSLMEGMLPEYALDGRVRQPAGAAMPTASPTNTYPCADGRWLCIAGNSDLIFARLMAAIGRPEMAADPAYRDQRPALREPRRRWTRRSPPGRGRMAAKDAEAILEAAEVPCSRLFDIADCAADPHFRARQAVQDIDDPLIGRTLHPGPTIRLDGERPEDVVRWTGPAVGAHTDHVLHTLLGLPRGSRLISRLACDTSAIDRASRFWFLLLLCLALAACGGCGAGCAACRRHRCCRVRAVRPRPDRRVVVRRGGRLVAPGRGPLRPRPPRPRSAACWCSAAPAGCRPAMSRWCRGWCPGGRSW